MSTILDALSRAERERRMGEIPAIERALLERTNAAPLPPEKNDRLRWLLMGLGLLLCGALIAVLILSLRGKPAAGPAVEQEQAAAPAMAPAPTVPVPQVETAPAITVAPESASPQRHQGDVRDSTATSAHNAAVSAPKRSASATVASAAARPAAVKPAAGKPVETASAIKTAPAKTAPAPNPAAPAASASLPWFNELPAGLRQELPNITLGGYIYSANVAERSILINGKLLREGDQLTQGLRLEQMRPDGVVFAYKDVRFRMRY